MLLVTYRTLLAFFSESKTVVININKFGEQYIDIFALTIIWVISFLGLIVLFLMIKQDRISKNPIYNDDKNTIAEQNKSYFYINNNMGSRIDKSEIQGVFVEPVEYIDENNW